MSSDPARDRRITALQQMLAEQPEDEFALYALALEYKNGGEDHWDEAEALFEKLLKVQPDQLYGWYQLGDLRIGDGRPDEAREALEAGLERAEALGDAKAAGELQALLDQV
ncbi:MAG: tetratricopeptide repeat protein [Bradymonadia bacterium]